MLNYIKSSPPSLLRAFLHLCSYVLRCATATFGYLIWLRELWQAHDIDRDQYSVIFSPEYAGGVS